MNCKEGVYLKLRIRLKKHNIWMFFLLLPLLETSYISNNLHIVHEIIVVLKYCSIVLTFILFLTKMRINNKISKTIIFILGYVCVTIISTIINNGEIMTAIVESLQAIAVFLIAEMLIEHSLSDFVTVVYPIFFLFGTINFISMVLYPDGMYSRVMQGSYVWVSNNNWFLGLENSMTAYLIPFLALSYIYMLTKRTKYGYIQAIFMTIICMYVPIVRHKGSMLVCFVLFIVLCILAYWKMLPDFLNARTYFVANIIFFIVVVLLSESSKNLIILIENILNRDTLSIRTEIWGKVFDLLPQHPLLGFGYESGYAVSEKLRYDSAHNQYLWVLYRGGLIQFCIFIKFIWDTIKALYKNSNYAVVKIVSAAFGVLLLMWQTEAINNNVIMLFWVFAYNVGIKSDELYLGEKEFSYKKILKQKRKKEAVN